MATIIHINEAEYAAKALDLLNGRRGEYVNYAFGLLQQSLSPGQAGERLENIVKSEMEIVLFEYLKHCGSVNGEIRHVYNTYGYCRRIRRTPSKRDVPSNLLDIKVILPNYEEVIGNVLVDAEQLWIISEVEAAKEMAKGEVIISP